MSQPINLTAGPVTEVVFLDPARPHTKPDERGCPDCDEPAYFSGCEAEGCNGWGCPDCGTGCDLDFVDAEDGGRCASYDEDDDEEGES
ncbi:hypothetical protein [Streptomyces sp. NPDC059176]|uniref:hypothetical protein n=1 Tax=Streptomyces sp. NPDC059176 TaxID=3346758 RepID=UPI0036B2C3CA